MIDPTPIWYALFALVIVFGIAYIVGVWLDRNELDPCDWDRCDE